MPPSLMLIASPVDMYIGASNRSVAFGSRLCENAELPSQHVPPSDMEQAARVRLHFEIYSAR